MNKCNIGDLILLTIKRIGINGEGVGFYKKQTVFVEDALPGEVVEVEIKDVKPKYLLASVTKRKVKASGRIDPLCPYYPQCGGCQLQHLSYPQQLKEKKNLLLEALTRYCGDVDFKKVADVVASDDELHYRNKSALPVRHDGERVRAGMYLANTNKVIYIDDCLVEDSLITDIRNKILLFLTNSNVDIYNPRMRSGILRYLVIRAFSSEEVQVTFVLYRYDKNFIRLLEKLDLPSVFYSLNSDPKSIDIFGSRLTKIKGKDKIFVKISSLKMYLSPASFFQLNLKTTSKLYQKIAEVANLAGHEKIVDCYCGVGGIAAYLAPFALEVRGIDTNRACIEDAKYIASANKLKNLSFYAGDVTVRLHEFKENGFIPDLVVLDPPRKGLDDGIIDYLKASPPAEIIYVSCNPATLAKNLNQLAHVYQIMKVIPFDMFPQTIGIETLCLLSKRDKTV